MNINYLIMSQIDHVRCSALYSVPHYKTGFLIFGHLVDYLHNHACYKHTQYIKMITVLY